MTDVPQIEQLLEDLLESGATPEEACRTCPELLPQVRAGLRRLRLLEDEVGALFPPSDRSGDGVPPAPPPTEMPHIPGYEVEGLLGYGGMGVVYRAKHLRLNRPVALKMLLSGAYARPRELERFLREAEAVAGLRHPNIVQVHNAGEVDGRPYFTMELVEGGSLAQKIAGAPQPAREAAALVAMLADGIHAAHTSGIVHRDLKPGNVLLTADGAPKVSDFGLARRFQEGSGLTLTGAPVGTPSYMAPEQARGDKSIGPATDVYALGAILYECLTGRPPFRAETATATLQQVVADEPVPPARLNPQVPRDLATICLKCLERIPARRYPSAAALADDLRRFEHGEPIAASPAGWPERAAKWARRRPATAVLLAAGVLMFAGVTAAAGWYVDHRARLQSERDSRAVRVNGAANASLDQAEIHLKVLRARLDDPFKVQELLSDIDQWQAAVRQPRQYCDRVDSAIRGNEALVTEETQAHLRAVEAAVDREEASYRLARDLDDIWAEALSSVDWRRVEFRTISARYAAFFAGQGVDIDHADKVRLVSAITSSPIRSALVAGLDYWALLIAAENRDDPRVALLFELMRAADPDPWRDRFRDPAVWGDRAAIVRLADEVDVERQSPMILVILGRMLIDAGGDATGLYRRAMLAHPRDFWLHFRVASDAREPAVKVGLYLGAIAIRPTSAVAYGNLSIAAMDQGDYRAAEAAANRAIELDPKLAAAYNALGEALLGQKDLPRAIRMYQKASELARNDVMAYLYHGKALSLRQDWPAAVEVYRKATEVDPGSAAAFWHLGIALRNVKDLQGSVAACRKATELDPTSAAVCHELGVGLYHCGKKREAVAQFRKAIELDPRYVLSYNNLGRVLMELKDLPGAIAVLRKAIELNPDLATAHGNLGLALRENKDLPGAIAAYQKAIELDPGNAVAHNNLGTALMIQRDFPGAIAAYQKAIQLDPKMAPAHHSMGLALRENKDLPGAVDAFKKAIELDPGRFMACYNLGITFQLQRRYAEAEQAYLAAIKAQPAFVPPYNSLAWLLANCPDDKVRDGKRALEYATQACERTAWKVPGYVDTLATAYAEAGQFEEAIRSVKRALDDSTYEARFRPGAVQRLELYRQKKPFRDPGP